MKRNLIIFSLVVLSLLVCIALPIWIGPDMQEHGFVLGLLVEWVCGVIAIAFVLGCVYICLRVVSGIWEFFDELLSK
jgi:hypothetical protein